MKVVFALILLTSTTQSIAEENIKSFDFKNPNKPYGDGLSKEESEALYKNNPCKFPNLNLPENVNVFAAGGYAGKKIDFQIDQSGNQTGQIDVAVNSPNKPVVLILGAYDPTIWNIGWTKGTNILAVFASGYHRQVIAGLPKQTPRLVSTYDNKGTCGYFYIKEEGSNALNPGSRILFNRQVNMVFIAKNGSVVVGSDISDSDSLITSADTSPSSYNDKSASLAGVPGLENAVKLGLLRVATKEDAIKWAESEQRNMLLKDKNQDIPPVAGGRKLKNPNFYNGYVVLKSFTFPEGLYGAHSGTFFVPKGVQIPKGNPGHSVIYDFNTLQCIGFSCGH